MPVRDPGVLVLTVHHLPDRSLRANSRDGTLSKYERSRLVKEERTAFGLEATAFVREHSWPSLTYPLRLNWLLYVPAWRGDWDGWVVALKPWQDALVDVHLLMGDSPVYVRGGSVEIKKDKLWAPRTELYIEGASHG